jgi:periplasmic protein TonB
MIDWRDPDGRPQHRITPLTALRWTTAAVVVATAHGAGAWFALTWKPALAAPGEPPPAVMIDLAPSAVSPEAPAQDLAPGPQMTEAQPETTPDVPEKPDTKPEEKPEPEAEEVKQPVEPPPPLPPPQPDVPIPKLPEKPNAEAVLAPPPPKPKVEKKKPPPKVKKVENKKPVNQDKPQANATTAPTSLPNPRADSAAAPSSSSATAPSMAPASWKGALMAHLNQHKRFPAGAADAGTATVAFTITRSGAVTGARLVRSSGDAALDAEAVSLPRRASPVPEPPPSVPGGTITLAVPIRFSR